MQAGYGSGLNAQYIFGQSKNSTRADKPAGKPIGTPAWIQFAFSINGMNVYRDSSLPSQTVISLLNANKPIYCDVENSTHTESHALVLWKYSTTTGTAMYTLMDPGKTSGTNPGSVTAIAATNGDLKVTARYGTTYDIWRSSYYVTP
ncbi:MAG: hypothetical protein K2N29_05720, partial [Ruminiclostridium sp.]|nr:hypothetical protein [Ruminiclostridium sp.]